jgi:hypothetical protein
VRCEHEQPHEFFWRENFFVLRSASWFLKFLKNTWRVEGQPFLFGSRPSAKCRNCCDGIKPCPRRAAYLVLDVALQRYGLNLAKRETSEFVHKAGDVVLHILPLAE